MGSPTIRFEEFGAVTAGTNRQQGLLSPEAARLLYLRSYPKHAAMSSPIRRGKQ